MKFTRVLMVLALAGFATVAHATPGSNGEPKSHEIDLRGYAGTFTRTTVDFNDDEKVHTTTIELTVAIDAKGNQILVESGDYSYYSNTVLTSNPSTGLFSSSAVFSPDLDNPCTSLNADKARIQAKRVYYKCSGINPGKAPYHAVEIEILSADSFVLTYSDSSCLFGFGGHFGCSTYGGMSDSYSETYTRKK